ncbi:hypothetical protein BTO06_12440 [Tenacibaculum sp. SZ-18]|uniref:hypothetical protein n=1 Tax=Tenacibaculum sp. SZ-18 TaxID=754423 RepID=UPI000C2D297E|nr:hypothetical protein [Tenacibaculum sp. SZ-18]AUC15910.1 hypothetical protein BTO06_12440 [Tenacibaculum sp. SZ-18]
MKSIYILIITLFSLTICKGQDKITFDIKEVFLQKKDFKKRKSDFIKKGGNFYEDKDYIVSKSCSGEWGGSIFFKNKKSGIEYSCSATCPVSVNLIDGKYIVTNSLAHLSGSSDIIEIKNPELMSVFKMPEPREIKNGIKHYYTGDTESKSRKGVKEIWNGFGILTLISFEFKEQLYHIISKDAKTFLATIVESELKIINQISKERIWDYAPETFKDEKGNLIVFFNNHSTSGYIEIIGNEIKVIRTK